jgi:hypothetical protein
VLYTILNHDNCCIAIFDIVEIRSQIAVDAGMLCGINCGRDVEDMKTIIDVMEQIQFANVLMQTKPR